MAHGKKLAVTAMTGCAAVLIGGSTLHSALGIGLAEGNVADVVAKVMAKATAVKAVRALEMLIIDEISMMSDELFDKVSGMLSIVRDDPAPFGGIQVILCGDFAQLPPVRGGYCFKSEAWGAAVQVTVVLRTLMRQRNDGDFQVILQELRTGRCSQQTYESLKARMLTGDGDGDEGAAPDAIQPTMLYSLRRDVDALNSAEYKGALTQAKGKGAGAASVSEKKYDTKYAGAKSDMASSATLKAQAKKWADSIGVPASVTLCVGAQVVVTANVDVENGIVNGSRGIVRRLLADGPEVRLLNGHVFVVEGKRLVDDANRLAVTYCPLEYAWALTINKSQGMTLDKAVIDLGASVFASGQAYTALSRVRDLESVRLTGLSKRSFMLHPDVAAFYERHSAAV